MAETLGRLNIPLYAFKCSAGHSFDVFGHMAEPPRSAPCEVCTLPSSRDYIAENKQVGFIDGHSYAFLPNNCGAELAGDERYKTRRVIKNKKHWEELCKKNDWTDYSNSSGPPE